MTSFDIYNSRKLDSSKIWILFLLLGWSYGSMDQMLKQVIYYLTFGGFGIWTIYRLLTLNGKIKNYNRNIAKESGLSEEDMIKLGLWNLFKWSKNSNNYLRQLIQNKHSGVENPILHHKDLDDLSEYFTNEFISINLPFNKKYEIFGVSFNISISYDFSYSSHIDWNKFMNDIYQIDIKVPEDYDLNYLVSTLIHELRHIIDFLDGAKSSGLSSFLMDIHLRNFNIGLFSEFYILVY